MPIQYQTFRQNANQQSRDLLSILYRTRITILTRIDVGIYGK